DGSVVGFMGGGFPSPPGPLSQGGRGGEGQVKLRVRRAVPVCLSPPLPPWERGPGGEGFPPPLPPWERGPGGEGGVAHIHPSWRRSSRGSSKLQLPNDTAADARTSSIQATDTRRSRQRRPSSSKRKLAGSASASTSASMPGSRPWAASRAAA